MIPATAKNRVIGLLGGSFNPAHEAHLYLSLYALKTLPLDEIWWLVTPQNPFKSPRDLAAYDQRFASAKKMADGHKRIRVLDIESRYHCEYTWQTIALLKRRFKGTHFVWLMGADHLPTFHLWRRWQDIVSNVPIIVFDRAPYSHRARRSAAYLRNRIYTMKNISLNRIKCPPALGFMPMPRQALSSTHIRKKLGEKAFL